ncbi:peptidase M48 [Nocardiopsis algeriensis]|uniref:Zn-dependent protease with chaperone function n=1 Tax=Nocardiopsis algeriensis TaxID=1478215 RepID=A0A841INQ2_9ACTN|nr:peptidase M48 [Nocardiopsis algeriensis]MBB6118335.1 Zn-dependent protease with chaperone function [Nocardiopsis algeriensis]
MPEYSAPPCPEELCEPGADEEAVPVTAHPWEALLLVVCTAVGLSAIALLAGAVWSLTGSPVWTAAAVSAVPAVCWAVRGLRHARHRAESVRVSPTQFPDAHRIVTTLSAAMGLPRPPEAYVLTAPGRGGAAAHGLRRYLVLPGSLFEGGARVGDPDALTFRVAHQLGHLVAGHTGFWRRVATLGAELVPGLGAALARAAEYTADNHAYAYFPEGAHTVRIHAGGPHLYPRVNMGEMADRVRTDRGLSLLLYHLVSRRPSNIRRMAALRDRGRRGRIFL